MRIDIKGKINEKKLAYSNTLLPLFEAIVNSIQAIEEYNSKEVGIVEVTLIRSEQRSLDFEKKEPSPEIIGFHIKDNGIGFNESNYESFNFAHSTYKSKIGGKGIGRFSWLRAFQKVEIESKFKENDNWKLRKFNFVLTKSGIEKHTLEDLKDSKERYTIVRLINLKEDYRKWCNNNVEDIAFKIIEHCFVYFLNPKCPRIIIKDEDNNLVVNDLFKIFTNGQVKSQNIKIRENKFKLNIVKLYKSKLDNKIHYCANTREVSSDKISIDIPEFDNYLTDNEGEQFSIAVYVEGNYLDNNVNEERTNINFLKGNDIDFPNETTQEELRKHITNELILDFADQIEELSKKRVERVKAFVDNHPRYKQLLKYRRNEIKKIPSTLTEDKMEIELFKIQQSLDLEVKQEASKVLNFISEENEKDFIRKHQDLFNKIIEVGNSKLSEYVIHRKLILDLFEKMLKEKATEKAVHNLIFPLQKLSDEIGFEDHNLWIIDDKLAYHKYLASDKRFNTIELVNSDSNDRPDLIVFNNRFAFSNDEKPYQSIVLIEFKRPMRDDYNDEENPIAQINRYAREIITGETKDKNDREFDFRKNTPIYAYIICDLTKKLKSYATDNGYKQLPNGDGFFFFNDNYNMYVEIMSFDKILNDSRERNRVLFEKLNLTTS